MSANQPGWGALFINKKSTHPSAPGYTGRANINGKEYTLSAWVRTPKGNGDKYLNIKIEAAKEAEQCTEATQTSLPMTGDGNPPF